MDRAETVTLFDDLCLLAPSMLIDPAIAWEPIDARSARARFTRGAETIAAVLKFDESDGTSATPMRWSTPVRTYRAFGPRRVSTFGEARWEPADAAPFSYGELEMQGIEYDVGP